MTSCYLRGGSWIDFQYSAPPTYRADDPPSCCFSDAGFRIKKQIKSTTKQLRGGSWILNRDFARAAFRHFSHPNLRDDFIGFRVKRRRRDG